MRKWFFTIIIVTMVLGGYFGIVKLNRPGNTSNNGTDNIQPVEQKPTPVAGISGRSFLSDIADVPFTSQAPLGQWADERYQNACEEASILMAMSWVNGTALPPELATEEIARLVKFQEDNYGHFHDRSAKDTAQLIKDYFKYDGMEYQTGITTQDIINRLAQGNIVIIPVNGQKLNNPYYKPPGPEEHMIIVLGFDGETNEFIVNDPGTRKGGNYRYQKDILENALRDYPTGYHEPIAGITKSMIVVRPKA